MKIKSVQFLKSIPSYHQEPTPIRPTFVFMGRSNVGKSSLINTLVGRKKIALTSATPGKTQMINYYFINEAWYLVDLPGYGWARVSQQMRKKWQKVLHDYLEKMQGLVTSFLLIDSRLPPQKNDLAFMRYLGENQIPFAIIFTKVDQLKKSEKANLMPRWQKTLQENDWEKLPPFFFSSSKTKEGQQTLLTYMDEILPSLIQ